MLSIIIYFRNPCTHTCIYSKLTVGLHDVIHGRDSSGIALKQERWGPGGADVLSEGKRRSVGDRGCT